MTNTELLTLIENFRQETLDRNRAVPKSLVLEQLHQLAMALVTGSGELNSGSGDPNKEQSPPADTPRRSEQNQREKSGENRNYSMLGVNYKRTLARFSALADQNSPEGQKLQASLASQREKIDESGAYSWEGDNPVYHKVVSRK